jgi:multisubunit Na+/H+ antiporter MnhB subunit
MRRMFVILGATFFVAFLIGSLFELEPAAVSLPTKVADNMAVSGVEHPVTAVLLNFRGYDTLLEIAVLLSALVVILAAGIDTSTEVRPSVDPVVKTLARLVAPVMAMVAIYLLWAGAFRPGGAFQAGAVLGAAAVLLHLSELIAGWKSPKVMLRLGLIGGFLIFLAVAAAMLVHGALLEYPLDWAGDLILLIESGLTISLGLILAGLFLFLTRDDGGRV